MSALALNLDVTTGGDRSLGAVRALTHQALEWNINHIDLASSEAATRHAVEGLLGCLFEQELKGHRDDLIITTNAGERVWAGPYGAGGGRKHILSSLDQTLGRLGLEYVDVLCAGPFDDETPLDETMSAIHDAIRVGKARAMPGCLRTLVTRPARQSSSSTVSLSITACPQCSPQIRS